MKGERKGEGKGRERNLEGLDPHNVWEGLTPTWLGGCVRVCRCGVHCGPVR